MSHNEAKYDVIDLHCDLTHYLVTVENASPDNVDDVGCAIPYLKQGNVVLQVMAISSVEKDPDVELSRSQLEWYKKLLSDYGHTFASVFVSEGVAAVKTLGKVGMIPAIENASSFCAPEDSLDDGFKMLDAICSDIGRPLYISLTHHAENRFGGGNSSDAGLKDDGRKLLEYISGKKIAVDLSHTSDALAHDIINHIDSKSLDLPVIASHSNFRAVHDHRRNLPDELAREIIARNGVIGINFLRAFMHPDNPAYLEKHIDYGLELGGLEAIALGADYFYTASHPDPTRYPFYFDEHKHAGTYQPVLSELAGKLGVETVEAIASGNVLRFMRRVEGDE